MTRDIQRVLCFVIGSCLLSVFAIPAFADTSPVNSDVISGYGLRNLENAVTIHASPATPSAGETVHFTAESTIYDLQNDDITWVVGGKTVAHGVGATSADTTVNAAGDSLIASLSVIDETWGQATAELVLVPLQVDLLYDAPTYVPPFYRGRALPSSGSRVRLQAVARLTKDGIHIPESNITYTWSVNGRAQENISGLGKSSAVVNAPDFSDTQTFSVRASAMDDTLSANASTVIPSVTPVVQLYEDHPLFGITFFHALEPQAQAPGDITVAAFPYFATAKSANDPELQYSWVINEIPVTASSTSSNISTIAASDVPKLVHVAVTHIQNFFLNVAGNWKFTFGSSGNKNAGDAASKVDAFHSGQTQ